MTLGPFEEALIRVAARDRSSSVGHEARADAPGYALRTLPVLEVANADFVTPQLLVGGDLDTRSVDLAVRQLAELVSVGVTHLVDVRIEWSDQEWVRGLAPDLDTSREE